MATSTSIRLHGDRVKAQSLAAQHVFRFLSLFRQDNAFQNLKQNIRKHVLYDKDSVIGEILLKTAFGVETVEVYAVPVVTRKKENEYGQSSMVCPAFKGQAVDGVSGYGGYFVFLDGYLSSNFLFIPKELPAFSAEWSSVAPFLPLDQTHQKYTVKSLSLLDYEQSVGTVDYIRLGDLYTGPANNIMSLEIDEVSVPLVSAPQGTFTLPSNYTNQTDTFCGGAWAPDVWCGAYNNLSQPGSGVVTWEHRFRLQTPTRSWEKIIIPAWSGGSFPLDGPGSGLGGTKTEYRRGDSIYCVDTDLVVYGLTPVTEENLVFLVSPSFAGGNDVQQMTLAEFRSLASAETMIGGDLHTVRPLATFHDWCLVTKEE